MTSKPGRKSDGYDPSRKQGLIPLGAHAVPSTSQNLSGDTGAMYIFGTRVVRPSRGGSEEWVSENIGRERQEKSKRRKEREEEEERLSQLLIRDGGLSSGAKALAQVRATAEGLKHPEPRENDKPTRVAFSAEAVKRIGFDPTSSKQIVNDVDVRRKVCDAILSKSLFSLHSARSARQLGKTVKEDISQQKTVRCRPGVNSRRVSFQGSYRSTR